MGENGSRFERESQTDSAESDPATNQPVLLVYESTDDEDTREFLIPPGTEKGTDLGVLDVPRSVEPGDVIETHLGEPFHVRALRGPDLFHHFERTGAPMVPRDIGLILGETGVGCGDRVLDAGTGTGVLAASMARVGAHVVTYERDVEAATVARENMRLAGVTDAVDVRTGDVTDCLDDLAFGPPFDVCTLDTADAAAVVEAVPTFVVDGGFVAVYSPFVEESKTVVETAHERGLSTVTTFETIQRHMDFDDRGSRPSTGPVGHTGYLTIARVRGSSAEHATD